MRSLDQPSQRLYNISLRIDNSVCLLTYTKETNLALCPVPHDYFTFYFHSIKCHVRQNCGQKRSSWCSSSQWCSWSLVFQAERETFVADNKPAERMIIPLFSIVDSYKKILDSPPQSPNYRTEGKTRNDMSWDMKMEQGLRQSAEYRRLVALQRNTVHADMEGWYPTGRRDGKGATPRSTDHLQTKNAQFLLKYTAFQVRRCISRSTYRKFSRSRCHMNSVYIGPDGPGSPKTKKYNSLSNDASRMTESDTRSSTCIRSWVNWSRYQKYPRGDDATTKKL
jgi:hypothetical protein